MTPLWTHPPRAKVYEALSAVGDGRVALLSSTSAEVESSSRDKKYSLAWSEDRKSISSNDNASYYQGYMGYPIVALLLKLGVIEYDPEIATKLAGIPWKVLNTKHKRNYEKAIEEVLGDPRFTDEDRSLIEAEVSAIYERLGELKIARGPRQPPPAR